MPSNQTDFDDKTISALYQQGATEHPSTELDARILELATHDTQGPPAKTLVRTTNKRRWVPFAGIAASAIIVTLIAPWQWRQATIPTPQLGTEVQRDTSPNRGQAQRTKAPVGAESDALLFESMPEPPANADTQSKMRLQSSSNAIEETAIVSPMSDMVQAAKPTLNLMPNNDLFAPILVKMAQGEQERAQQMLNALLKSHPEMKDVVPTELHHLLDDATYREPATTP